jgi:hypothetical protein
MLRGKLFTVKVEKSSLTYLWAATADPLPSSDHNPHEFYDVPDGDDLARAAGEFTRAFEAKANLRDTSEEQGAAPTAGSITQLLGKSEVSSSKAPEGQDQPPAPVPTSGRAESFTKAFEGVNAFSRDPAGLSRFDLNSADVGPASDATRTGKPGSFTRLFGSGEGILTPSGSDESSRSQSPGNRESPQRADVQPQNFTELFPALPATPKEHAGSVTEQFQSPVSWRAPESPLPSASPRASSSRQEDTPIFANGAKRPSPPTQGFERLVSQATSAPMPSPGATIVFDRAGSTGSGITESPAESEYTMVRKLSDLRSRVDVSGKSSPIAGETPAPAAAAPAWTPPPAPALPQWQAPQRPTPPQMPQTPNSAAAPQIGPSLGDRLVSFLPFILALTVINFLGLLAVLIILFATRK